VVLTSSATVEGVRSWHLYPGINSGIPALSHLAATIADFLATGCVPVVIRKLPCKIDSASLSFTGISIAGVAVHFCVSLCRDVRCASRMFAVLMESLKDMKTL
jgi:hypothetical protein